MGKEYELNFRRISSSVGELVLQLVSRKLHQLVLHVCLLIQGFVQVRYQVGSIGLRHRLQYQIYVQGVREAIFQLFVALLQDGFSL